MKKKTNPDPERWSEWWETEREACVRTEHRALGLRLGGGSWGGSLPSGEPKPEGGTQALPLGLGAGDGEGPAASEHMPTPHEPLCLLHFRLPLQGALVE